MLAANTPPRLRASLLHVAFTLQMPPLLSTIHTKCPLKSHYPSRQILSSLPDTSLVRSGVETEVLGDAPPPPLLQRFHPSHEGSHCRSAHFRLGLRVQCPSLMFWSSYILRPFDSIYCFWCDSSPRPYNSRLKWHLRRRALFGSRDRPLQPNEDLLSNVKCPSLGYCRAISDTPIIVGVMQELSNSARLLDVASPPWKESAEAK